MIFGVALILLMTSISGASNTKNKVVINGNNIVVFDQNGNKRVSINDPGVDKNASISFFRDDGKTLSAYMYQTGHQWVVNGGSDTITFMGHVDFSNAQVTGLH